MFWFANITNIPRKNPTENEVGNLFNTNVPRIPRKRWVTPVKIDASIRAVDPPEDFKFHTESNIAGELMGEATR